jgi:3-phosphoglycerate kinase
MCKIAKACFTKKPPNGLRSGHRPRASSSRVGYLRVSRRGLCLGVEKKPVMRAHEAPRRPLRAVLGTATLSDIIKGDINTIFLHNFSC